MRIDQASLYSLIKPSLVPNQEIIYHTKNMQTLSQTDSTTIVSRRSLVEQVVEGVIDWIFEGKFQSYDALPPEADLAIQFGVSRTVIREAIRRLAERGMILVAHGRRHRVRPPSPEVAADHLSLLMKRGQGSLRDLIELRMPLETEIVRLAAQRATSEDLAALKACLEAHREAETLSEQVQRDMQFHQLLAQASHNVTFTVVLEAVSELLTASRERTIGRVGNSRAVRHHEKILEAIVAGDADSAAAAMRAHLEMAATDLGHEGKV